MRAITTCLSLLLLMTVLGCWFRVDEGLGRGLTVSAAKGGLFLEMSLPERQYALGDTIPVTVVAVNESKEEMVLKATSGALMYLTLWRHTPVGWEQLKRFPETAVMIPSPWKLPPGGSNKFPVNLEVTPDWPKSEQLKLTAELNGRPDLKAEGLIEVFASRKDFDRARVD